jgi:transposase, IS5 family
MLETLQILTRFEWVRKHVCQSEISSAAVLEQINLKHSLVRLAGLIDWERLGAMSESFVSGAGRPATSPRLIAGLLYLQHAFDLSDEDVVWQWVENPYWQVFKGETFLQTESRIDPSSLTRWRKRLGEAGVEELLATTIEAAKRAGVIKASSVKTHDRRHESSAQGNCPSNRFTLAGAVP